MRKKQNAILIVNKEAIKLVKKLMNEKYRRDGFVYQVTKVDILLEALDLLKEKYDSWNTKKTDNKH